MNSALTLKLQSAVLALAGHGAIKDRLHSAFCDHLEGLDEQELPADTRQEFAEMCAAMHRARALPGDTVVRASVRKLSNEELQRFAALIVRIYALRIQLQSAVDVIEATAVEPAARRSAASGRESTPLVALLTLDRGASRTKAAGRS